MQNLVNDTPAKKNYDFIDSIRCIAMISIVMEHSFSSIGDYQPVSMSGILTYTATIQLVKFGTICFFLLSGFLIGEKFTVYSPLQYLKRRIDTTIAPWLFWSLLFLALMILNDVISAKKFYSGNLPSNYGLVVADHARIIYLYTNYWFIPNFLICIGILLLFKKHLYSYWLGAMLFLFTVAYIFNVYFEWIEPRHSTAIFGFVFFLWLGAQFNRHLAALEKWVNKIALPVWAILFIITFIISIAEVRLLTSLHSVDPFNSLRFSNILFSLASFFLLFKIKNFKSIAFLKPRETTYGIYLIHYILVFSLLPMIFLTINYHISQLPLSTILLYQLLRFIVVYSITVALVLLINKSRFKWVIGR